jgi:hypothetical protein
MCQVLTYCFWYRQFFRIGEGRETQDDACQRDFTGIWIALRVSQCRIHLRVQPGSTHTQASLGGIDDHITSDTDRTRHHESRIRRQRQSSAHHRDRDLRLQPRWQVISFWPGDMTCAAGRSRPSPRPWRHCSGGVMAPSTRLPQLVSRPSGPWASCRRDVQLCLRNLGAD